MKAIKKDVFDINKVTVVGSPTITSDGVASGFSSSNYLTIPYNYPDGVSNYTEIVKFTTSNDVTIRQAVRYIGQNIFKGIGIVVQNNTLSCRVNAVDMWKITTFDDIKPNTTYKVKFNLLNNVCTWTLYSNNNEIISEQKYAYNGNILFVEIELGNSANWQQSTPFLGTINLNEFKIYVDGELIYSPTKPITFLERKKEGFDLSKFTVVGSPTITENGVASGFSENDYVIIPTINYSNANSWEIYTQKFSISSLQNLDTILCNNTSTVGSDGIAIFIRASGKTSWSVQSVLGTFIFKRDANTNIQINTEYQCKLEFTGSAYNLYLSTNGGSFVLVDTYTSSTKANINISLAIGKGLGQYWKGNSIDLKQLSITVDGVEVFTGAKEKFYAIGDF